MAYLSNVDSGFPGYRGRVTESAATMAEVLQGAGYATLAIGKWHLAPLEDTTAVGPYNQWPLGRGFGRYYGFLDALTDHFYPDVVEDNHRVDPPGRPEDGYHLTEDLIDHSISYIRDQVSVKPEQPFFLYLSFGTAHCPHTGAPGVSRQIPRAIRRGVGCDPGAPLQTAERTRDHPGRRRPGAPQPGSRGVGQPDRGPTAPVRPLPGGLRGDARPHRRPPGQAGGVPRLDREGSTTPSCVVLSDNGASQEGGPDGGADIVTYEEDRFCTVEFNLERFDTIGGPHSQTNIPWGWAQAANTPLRWYKQNTYAGGVRTPLVISWPDGISDVGAVRAQFVHAIDIAPHPLRPGRGDPQALLQRGRADALPRSQHPPGCSPTPPPRPPGTASTSR